MLLDTLTPAALDVPPVLTQPMRPGTNKFPACASPEACAVCGEWCEKTGMSKQQERED